MGGDRTASSVRVHILPVRAAGLFEYSLKPGHCSCQDVKSHSNINSLKNDRIYLCSGREMSTLSQIYACKKYCLKQNMHVTDSDKIYSYVSILVRK